MLNENISKLDLHLFFIDSVIYEFVFKNNKVAAIIRFPNYLTCCTQHKDNIALLIEMIDYFSSTTNNLGKFATLFILYIFILFFQLLCFRLLLVHLYLLYVCQSYLSV